MRLLAVLLALMMVILPTTAQNDDTRPPLLRALSAVPDTAEIRNAPIIASFADYQAAFALRGIEPLESLAEVDRLDNAMRAKLAYALPNSGAPALVRFFFDLVEMPSVMGFDFFEIAQSVEAGNPPENAVVVLGKFDTQAVIEAHLRRNYTAEADNLGTVLCPSNGCEGGYDVDLANRNMANPFGGQLGQSQPIILTDNLILNARYFPLLTAMSQAAQRRIPSLADAKDVQAVANILAYRDYVSAVQLISPATVSIVDATASSGRFSNFKSKLDAMPALPPYTLLAIAHSANEDYEYGDILLIYPDIDSASQAYESILARLEVIESVSVEGRTVEQLFNEVGEFLLPQVVTDEKTNYSAVQLTIRSPLELENERNFALAYLRLYWMLMERDTVLFLPTE